MGLGPETQRCWGLYSHCTDEHAQTEAPGRGAWSCQGGCQPPSKAPRDPGVVSPPTAALPPAPLGLVGVGCCEESLGRANPNGSYALIPRGRWHRTDPLRVRFETQAGGEGEKSQARGGCRGRPWSHQPSPAPSRQNAGICPGGGDFPLEVSCAQILRTSSWLLGVTRTVISPGNDPAPSLQECGTWFHFKCLCTY